MVLGVIVLTNIFFLLIINFKWGSSSIILSWPWTSCNSSTINKGRNRSQINFFTTSLWTLHILEFSNGLIYIYKEERKKDNILTSYLLVGLWNPKLTADSSSPYLKKVHGLDLSSSLDLCCFGTQTKALQPNIFKCLKETVFPVYIFFQIITIQRFW